MTLPAASQDSSTWVQNFLLSSTIRGILAQRLVRVVCPYCKEIDPQAGTGEEFIALGITTHATLYRGRGCEKCAFTGYLGRTGIFELLVVDDAVRRLILQNADPGDIRELGRKHGMRILLEDGARKVMAGVTTLSEVLKVTQEA
jgi:general secretion pathway protein E